ncbi:hypothetical protein GCM10018963_57330 [Saccharothrix longispora]
MRLGFGTVPPGCGGAVLDDWSARGPQGAERSLCAFTYQNPVFTYVTPDNGPPREVVHIRECGSRRIDTVKTGP